MLLRHLRRCIALQNLLIADALHKMADSTLEPEHQLLAAVNTVAKKRRNNLAFLPQFKLMIKQVVILTLLNLANQNKLKFACSVCNTR